MGCGMEIAKRRKTTKTADAGEKNKCVFNPFGFSLQSYGEAKPADAVTITSTDEVSTAMIAADGVPIPTAMAMFTDYSGHNVQRDDNNNSTMGKVAANMKDNFISAGKDLASSMMAAAPYLPLVYKIAVFIVPGLSSYYILLYAVNVAAITAQAVQNYQSGQSMTSVTSEAGMKLLYNSLVRVLHDAFICTVAVTIISSSFGLYNSALSREELHFSRSCTRV